MLLKSKYFMIQNFIKLIYLETYLEPVESGFLF